MRKIFGILVRLNKIFIKLKQDIVKIKTVNTIYSEKPFFLIFDTKKSLQKFLNKGIVVMWEKVVRSGKKWKMM